MNVLIYGRVSTHSQDVTRQVEELEEYCKIKNYKVVDKFIETISGKFLRKQRKEINRLMDYISNNNNINGVLVWELSRLGRNTLDVLEIIKELTDKKIWVFSKKENLYTLDENGNENPSTKLTLTILSGVSTLERESILSRSISGLIKSVNDGNWTGGKYLPYGYKRDEKKLVIEEEESLVVKEIFNLYLKGFGTKKIANELNRRKILTRYNKVSESVIINNFEKKGEDFKWKDGTIYSILTNPIYIGKKIGKGKLEGLKLSSPRIIEDNTFYEVQELLKNTTKKSTTFFYFFDKKIKCGICGKNYHPIKRSTNKDNRYVCLSRRYNETCGNYGIGIPKLQDGVWSTIKNNDVEINNILQSNNDNNILNNEIFLLKESINNSKISIGQIESQETKLLDLYLDGKINKELYEFKYTQLTIEKEKYLTEINLNQKDLEFKLNFKDKQSNSVTILKNIKESKHLLKKTFNNVITKIVIYPIRKHNLSSTIKVNKQDKFIYIEVFTYLNYQIPLCFIISQRTNIIITPNSNDYNKIDGTLNLGGYDNNDNIEQEENYNLRHLYHLKNIDNNSLKKQKKY